MQQQFNRRKGLARTVRAFVEPLETRQLLTIAFPTYLLGPDQTTEPIAAAADRDGNVLILGSFSGNVDFNPSSRRTYNVDGGSGDSVFVAKYSPAGGLYWVMPFVDGANGLAAPNLQAITVDKRGNFFLSGTIDQDVDADPWRKTRVRSSVSGGTDVIAFRFSADGAFAGASVQAVPNGGNAASAEQLKLDAAGNLFVAGGQTSGQDYLAKFSAVTTPAWITLVPDTRAPRLGIDRSGNPAVVAQTSTAASMAITRFTSGGRYLSRQVLTTSAAPGGTVQPASLDFDASNYPVIAGNLTGYADFNPSNLDAHVLGPIQPTNAFSNIFLSRYTPKGTMNFAEFIGGTGPDFTTGATIDRDSGDIYLTGSFNDLVDFDPGRGAYIMDTGNHVDSADAPSDLFVAKYTGAGNFASAAQLEAPDIRDDAVTFALAPANAATARVYVLGLSTGFRNGEQAVSILETVR